MSASNWSRSLCVRESIDFCSHNKMSVMRADREEATLAHVSKEKIIHNRTQHTCTHTRTHTVEVVSWKLCEYTSLAQRFRSKERTTEPSIPSKGIERGREKREKERKRGEDGKYLEEYKRVRASKAMKPCFVRLYIITCVWWAVGV